MKIYLDVCCLNRPFDNQTQARVAIEAAAVTNLLQLIDANRLIDYSSEMAHVEIERMKDPDRRRKVASLLPPKQRIMPLSVELLDSAEELVTRGFDLADAVHLAAARLAKVDLFLTVDDGLLRRARRYRSGLGIRVTDPVSFLREFRDEIDR